MDTAEAQPHAVGPEKSVLSSILQDPAEFLDLATSEGIGAEHFYLPAHSGLFAILLAMQTAGEAIEFVGLTQKLLNNGQLSKLGGPSYIAELYGYSPSPGHFRAHIRHIKDKSILRQLYTIGNNLARDAIECGDDTAEVLDTAERDIMAIRDASIDAVPCSIQTDIRELLGSLERRIRGAESAKGLFTGYDELDRLTGGLKPSEMIVIAARPSMGKTAFMMNIVEHLCVDQGKPCMVFSAEMSRAQLVDRLTYSRAQFDVKLLDRGYKPTRHELEKIRRAAIEIGNAPLVLDDKSSPTINEIRAKARRQKRKHGLAIIAIDYLQLLKSTSKQAASSREREIAEISAGIKSLAKDLNIPVIVLAQLNRDADKRTGAALGKARMSDLRESGAIEQDADVIAFLHRAEKYAVTEDEKAKLAGRAELNIAKNRNGATGTVPLTFQDTLMRFVSGYPIQDPSTPAASSKGRWD